MHSHCTQIHTLDVESGRDETSTFAITTSSFPFETSFFSLHLALYDNSLQFQEEIATFITSSIITMPPKGKKQVKGKAKAEDTSTTYPSSQDASSSRHPARTSRPLVSHSLPLPYSSSPLFLCGVRD